MDEIKIIPSKSGSPFDPPMVDVSGIKRKFIDLAYGTDSPNQTLDIYLPDEGEGPYPLIVYIHGGAFIGGHQRDGSLRIVIDGIRRGYAVAGIGYRFSSEVLFPQPLFDVKTAIRYLKAHAKEYCIDPERIGALGCSAGGYFVSMLATSAGVAALEGAHMGWAEEDSSIQAAVGLFGVYDLVAGSQFTFDAPKHPERPVLPNFADKFVGVNCREHANLVALTDPGSYVTESCPPTLLQYGTGDVIVPYENSDAFAEKINSVCGEGRAKVEVFPGWAHADPRFEEMENIDLIFEFFNEHLK